jgi:adenylate kinase family enzyme
MLSALSNCQRIMIIGRPGSGKSTFAVRLKQLIHLPIVHLDKYYFEQNWVPLPQQTFFVLHQEFIAKPLWIIEGCSTKTYEHRYARATMCIYLNTSKWTCLYRLFKRFFIRHPEIDDRALGCKESVSWSLIKYLWHFDNKVKPILQKLQQNYPQVKWIEIKSDEAANQLLTELRRS